MDPSLFKGSSVSNARFGLQLVTYNQNYVTSLSQLGPPGYLELQQRCRTLLSSLPSQLISPILISAFSCFCCPLHSLLDACAINSFIPFVEKSWVEITRPVL